MLVLLVSSFLNAFYFLPIVFKAFFGKSEEEDNKTPVKIQEANLCLVIPLIITAIISVVLFFYPTMFVNLIKIGLSI